jgi:uncharacterized Zn-binding protein involved in type VI secretion
MPADNPVARVDKDIAGSMIISGSNTVYTDGDSAKFRTATVGGTTAGPKNTGDIIVASPVTVYAENRKVAVIGARTARGIATSSGSQTVFAGSNGPGAPVEIS